MRMDRRAGLLNPEKLPTLAELIADMSVLCGGGTPASVYSTTTEAARNIDISSYSVTYPYYLFICKGTALKIAAVSGSGTPTSLKSYGTLSLTASNTSIDVSTTSFGLSYIIAKFPHYSDAVVRKALSKMTLTHRVSRASNSSGSLSIATSTIVSNALYITTAAKARSSVGMSLAWGNAYSSYIITKYGTSNGSQTYGYLQDSGSNTYVCAGSWASDDNIALMLGGTYELKDAS